MNAIEIRNLRKTWANGKHALLGFDLDIAHGDFFALLGPNGAGKSTTIGILSGLVNKTAGSVSIYGHDIDTETEQAKALIGVVPQELNFSLFETCIDIVVNQGGYYGVPKKLAVQRAEKYMKLLELWDKREQPSRTLSGGMKRRLMIARSLIHEPKLLILDEPTTGIDVEMRRSTWSFLRDLNKQGTSILLTTHYLEEAEKLCRNIAIIDHGDILSKTTLKELLSTINSEVFVLELNKPIKGELQLSEGKPRKIDDTTIELEMDTHRNLNGIFQELTERNINVRSFRQKSNRLEELFLSMTSENREP
ncbi:MAG: ABC transporter ATP-binding protein [Candidatus Eutrophobiaceae bacterium]